MAAIYKGFSTIGKKSPPYSLTDIELVKTDLLNHFNTRKGERLMLPEFGSIIHDLIMDPLDNITKDEILSDVKRVINSDPRVELLDQDIYLTEIDNGIRVEIELNFIPQDTADHLVIDFEREIREGI